MLAGLTALVKARDEVMTTALLYVCSITAMFNIKGRSYRLKELEKLIR